MRIRKIIGSFFCALFMLTSMSVCAEESTGPEADMSLHATAAVLMDADSGRVLYGKNANQPMAMASTTKIMTCIVILEKASLDDTLTVSGYAASMPKVKLYLKKGEQYKVRDLLYSLMLESHNDSAVALAEYVGKQYLPEELRNKPTEQFNTEESRQAVSAFAGLMNEKASELGCENTWFITPNGLDANQEFTLQDGTVVRKEHCTTASELARIMSYCIRESTARELFLEITQASNYNFSANGRGFSCTNHNAFLNMMSGAISGKTGFTNKAGYCYVGALERDGRTFVVTLLACGWPNNKTWKWSDTSKLMQYGIDNFFYRSFLEEGIIFDENCLKPIPVLNGRTNILGETAYTDIEIKSRRNLENGGLDTVSLGVNQGNKEGILLRSDEEIIVKYQVQKALEAPVESGREVGSVEYSVDGVVYLQEKIVTADRIGKIDYPWCLEEILSRFLLVN